jgi:hypothetical protein
MRNGDPLPATPMPVSGTVSNRLRPAREGPVLENAKTGHFLEDAQPPKI